MKIFDLDKYWLALDWNVWLLKTHLPEFICSWYYQNKLISCYIKTVVSSREQLVQAHCTQSSASILYPLHVHCTQCIYIVLSACAASNCTCTKLHSNHKKREQAATSAFISFANVGNSANFDMLRRSFYAKGNTMYLILSQMSVCAGWPCLFVLAFCAGCWRAVLGWGE